MGFAPEYFQTTLSQVAIAEKGFIDRKCSAEPRKTLMLDFSW
jgi:hypothetical protein